MKTMEEKPLATVEVQNQIDEIEAKMDELAAGRDYMRLTPDELKMMEEYMQQVVELKNAYNWFDQPFTENGKCGVKDVFGKVIVPAQFDNYVELHHYDIRKKAIPMERNGRHVLVKTDGSGEVIPGTEYDHICHASFTHYFTMWKDGKFGFMSSNGTVFVPCICDEYGEPIGRIILYRAGEKWGFLDFSGNVVTPKFDEIVDPEPCEWVKVRIGNMVGYVDEDGNITLDIDEAYWTFEYFDD